MALRDQPYLPLYIQDVLTDEKLVECSALAHGVYFRLLCLLHKQDPYGEICLKAKHKQNKEQKQNFSGLLSKQMPFVEQTIFEALTELLDEGVLTIEGDILYQKRMRNDGRLSLIRAESGKTGGSVVTKQYGKEGYLYWMTNYLELNKIGISVNPKNRLYRLRSDLGLKDLEIKELIQVEDMGAAEDFALSFFSAERDGEWVRLTYDDMEKKFVSLKANIRAKTKANTEIEIESNSANSSVLKSNKGKGKVVALDFEGTETILTFDAFWELYDKKVARDKCEKAFKAIGEPDRKKMAGHIPKYKLAQPNKKYRKDPYSFLFNKSWNDEIITDNATISTPPTGPGNGKMGTSAARVDALSKW